MIGDVVSRDSDDSDDDQGGTDAMPTTADAMAVPVRTMPLLVPTEHAFQFCRPVVLVDGTFLTGKYRGTLMMATAVDPEDQIVPMAFVLAEGENNELWSWFMRLLRVLVLGPTRTICLISDHHAGLLNAAGEQIDGFPPLVHRWCMRHFAANWLLLWQRERTMNHGHGSCGFYVCKCLAQLALYV